MTRSARDRATRNARAVGRWASRADIAPIVARGRQRNGAFDADSARRLAAGFDFAGEVNWTYAAELLNRVANGRIA